MQGRCIALHVSLYADGFEQKRYVVCVINLSSVHSKNSACAQRLLNSISHIYFPMHVLNCASPTLLEFITPALQIRKLIILLVLQVAGARITNTINICVLLDVRYVNFVIYYASKREHCIYWG